MPAIESNDVYVQLVTFEVTDRVKQHALLAAITEAAADWVSALPGFVSASFHLSHDGTRLFNYAQWQSRAAFENFVRDGRRSGWRRRSRRSAFGR